MFPLRRMYSQSHEINWKKFLKSEFQLPNAQNQKPMSASHVQHFLLFKDQSVGKYLKFGGGIRIGRILEDIDSLAGMIAIKHSYTTCFDTTILQCVTASLDKIELLQEFSEFNNYRLSGYVSFTGNSSMEVSISCHKIPQNLRIESFREENMETLVMTARFIMVCLNKNSLEKIIVPKLLIGTKGEEMIEKRGAENKSRREYQKEISIFKQAPTVKELQKVHQFFLNSTPDGNVKSFTMKSTMKESIIVTHPQDKNVYNKIFGGYLMRIAYELAYATCILACKVDTCQFKSIDDISFKRPVNIGSVLILKSRIIFTKSNLVQVHVENQVVDPKNQSLTSTNDFYFTFLVDCQVSVLPETYEESMIYIEGQRRSGWE